MGFLTSADVIECSATDLVGSYVGHTGPKVINKLTEALGKVLFIDEAYRLSQGQYASEAVAEIVDSLTKPKFMNKLIVILAGYESDMNELLRCNQGLSSRFSEKIMFSNLEPIHCLTLLQKTLTKSQIELCGVDDPSSGRSKILGLFRDLSGLKAWANGRDVLTAAKSISQSVFESADPASPTLAASSDLVITELTRMYNANAMRGRTSILDNVPQKSLPARTAPPQAQLGPPSSSMAPSPSTRETSAPAPAKRLKYDLASSDEELDSDDDSHVEARQNEDDDDDDDDDAYGTRDAGVDDATWHQLQHDAAEAANAFRAQQASYNQALGLEASVAEELRQLQQLNENAAATHAKAEDEAKRRHEQLRLERLRAAAEAVLARIAEEKAQEEKKQQKLRQMGVCVAGFQWIKQAGGYRCAGGSHFVSEAQLG